MSEERTLRRLALGVITRAAAPEGVEERRERLTNFRRDGDDILCDLMRHPALKGVPTDVDSSKAHYLALQTYRVNPAKPSMDLQSEVYQDIWYESMAAVVIMDAVNTAESISDEYLDLESEDVVDAWAESRAAEIASIVRERMIRPEGVEFGAHFDDAWDRFVEEYIETWSAEFAREVARAWESRHAQHPRRRAGSAPSGRRRKRTRAPRVSGPRGPSNARRASARRFGAPSPTGWALDKSSLSTIPFPPNAETGRVCPRRLIRRRRRRTLVTMKGFSELLAKAKAGDQEALAALHGEYEGRAKAVVRRRLGPPLRRQFDTTDIAQSVFLEVLRDLPRFEDRGEVAFLHWLYIKVENKVRSKFRKILRPAGGLRECRLDTAGEEALAGDAGGAITHVGSDEPEALERAQLRALIAELPEDQRQVIELRDEQQLSYADVAERLGLASADAARMRYGRALTALRRRWKTSGSKPR